MKAIKLALVLMFVVGMAVGCGGGGSAPASTGGGEPAATSGGGGGGSAIGTVDDCVKAGMDQLTKNAGGMASAAEAGRPTIEQSCQVCKDPKEQAAIAACNMIIEAYRK